MNTQVLSIEASAAMATAYQQLAANGVLVAPTDTVYGVMCRFDQPQAIDQLYEVKGRPPEKAIPVLIGDATQLTQLTPLPVSPIAQALAQKFWPGPLTLVIPALATLPAVLTAGQPTVGVRLPDHPWLRALLRQSGPLAATSANRSGEPEAATVDAVLAQLQGRVKLVLADPALDHRVQQPQMASTVLALTAAEPRLLRPGPLAQQVQHFLQEHFGRAC
ncbi:MAG: threonylcarbamoyl-AMP synthase [Caldilineaceae bacterium]|nr:threonylcarbamoyl-AMP synthase [Caldilineaceae bacterium]